MTLVEIMGWYIAGFLVGCVLVGVVMLAVILVRQQASDSGDNP